MKKLSRFNQPINILADKKTSIEEVEKFLQKVIANNPEKANMHVFHDASYDRLPDAKRIYYHNIALLSGIIKDKLNNYISRRDRRY